MPKRAPLTPIDGNKTVRRELSMFIKDGIFSLAAADCTTMQISRQMNIFRTTIQNYLKRSQTTLNGKNQFWPDRPFIVFDQMTRLILRHVRMHFKMTWNDACTVLKLNFCRKTFLKIFKINEIIHWKVFKHFKLTSELVKKKLNWARTHEHWKIDQWSKIIWSDESFVARGTNKRRKWSFDTSEQKWDRDKLQKGPKKKQLRIMVWEGFWEFDRSSEWSDLYMLKRDFESKKHDYSFNSYIQILENNLLKMYQSNLIFMQNNVFIHSFHKMQIWFQKMDIQMLKWFSYSSNLNFIENLWTLLKKKIFKMYFNLNSLEGKKNETESQLFKILQQAWENIRDEVVQGLIESMSRRIQAVIAAEGWHTKY